MPYVENTLYSTTKYSCVRPVHTLYIRYQATWIFFYSYVSDSRAQCHCGPKGAELPTGYHVLRKPVVITFPISKKKTRTALPVPVKVTN